MAVNNTPTGDYADHVATYHAFLRIVLTAVSAIAVILIVLAAFTL